MPIHNLQCTSELCDYTYENEYISLDKIDGWGMDCPRCGEYLELDLRQKSRRSTRSHKFPEFRLQHTRRLDGDREGREIRSLADIRRFERDHQDEQVCVEAFSYDGEQHIPDPVSNDKPVRMTDEQKRDFVEKFRAMNIKDERSARDYE